MNVARLVVLSIPGVLAFVAACSSAAYSSDGAPDATTPGAESSSSGGPDGGPPRATTDGGGGSDSGGGGDSGSGSDSGPLGPTNFGKSLGDDPCVATGTAPAWTQIGRCPARAARTPIVSSQTGALARTKSLFSGSATIFLGGEATFGNDGTFFGSGDFLAAFPPTTFATKWTGFGDSTPPVVGANGRLFTSGAGIPAKTRALNAATGNVMWTRVFGFYMRALTELPDGSLVFLSTEVGMAVRAISPVDGSDLWSTTIPGAGFTGSMVASSSGVVYVASDNTGISAISSTTHAIMWNVPTLRIRAIALDERAGRLYFVTKFGNSTPAMVASVAVDGTGLTMSSPIQVNSDRVSQLALGAGGFVYFAAGGYLYGVDTTNDTSWEAATGAYSGASPVVGGDGTVYFGAHKPGSLHAMAFTKTGALRWDTQLATVSPTETHVGSAASIAPTGHLELLFPATSTLYEVGP